MRYLPILEELCSSDSVLFMEVCNILEQGTPDEIFNSTNPRIAKFVGACTK